MGCAGSKPAAVAAAGETLSSSSTPAESSATTTGHASPPALTHQRSSARGKIISADERSEMLRRASEEDLNLPKAVVTAIDASKLTLVCDLAQPSQKEEMNLNFPQLTIFPVRIFKVSGLTSLKLKNNRLTILPNDIGTRLPNLVSLDVSENQLSELPTSLSNMSKLETLVSSII